MFKFAFILCSMCSQIITFFELRGKSIKFRFTSFIITAPGHTCIIPESSLTGTNPTLRCSGIRPNEIQNLPFLLFNNNLNFRRFISTTFLIVMQLDGRLAFLLLLLLRRFSPFLCDASRGKTTTTTTTIADGCHVRLRFSPVFPSSSFDIRKISSRHVRSSISIIKSIDRDRNRRWLKNPRAKSSLIAFSTSSGRRCQCRCIKI